MMSVTCKVMIFASLQGGESLGSESVPREERKHHRFVKDCQQHLARVKTFTMEITMTIPSLVLSSLSKL
jgi:hypothetical protein